MNAPSHEDSISHCIAKIVELVSRETPDRRDLLQLGYNLGRLSELTGAGRGPFWDAWKTPVSVWDQAMLQTLAHQLQINPGPLSSGHPDIPSPSEESRHPFQDSCLDP
ncbi:hypothetical protein [Tautonia marina]|uniref:hypothetical protein n=1 Tax=Tautonia marina TaxID=2653855 RepID=UPI00191BE4C5|nr:hypothetical protein [Tautonia marina]